MLIYSCMIVIVGVLAYCARMFQCAKINNLGFSINESNEVYDICVNLSIFVLAIVSGFREGVGTDYWGYTSTYLLRADRWVEDLLLFKEPGLGFLSAIATFFIEDYTALFLLAAIITVYLNIKTIAKYSIDIYYGIMLYVFIGAWHGSFNGVRQYLAAAILFVGYRFMLEKKFWHYCAVVFMAMLFHRTAIIAIPIYIIIVFFDEKRYYISVVLFSVFMRLSYDYLFAIMSVLKEHDQSGYSYMQTEVNILRVLVALAPLLFYFLIDNKDDYENKICFRLLVINAGLMFAASGSAYLARICIYTDIFSTIAIPKLLYSCDEKIRDVFGKVVLFSYFLFWCAELYLRWDSLAYHSIFESI